mmetsp:Transcript_49547/g.112478  ORF Transcript_49547/g.112478 Transcript_49547/m.112478 type:complete len:382 (-) Transcript_49547:243-1388(-)
MSAIHSSGITRWGIAGLGKISADFCAALTQTEGAVITAVAGSSPDGRAEAFAERFAAMQGGSPIAACADYAALAAREDVDVCYVGTINTTHADISLQLMDASKPVLCEKPIGINTDEVAALVAKSKEKGVFLMEGMWSRFLPAVVKAREILRAGEIGKVVAVHADFGFRCDDPPESRMFSKELAGGGLLDIGIYPIAFSSMAFGGGMPSKIAAAGSLHGETGVDTSAGITLLYDAKPAAASDSDVQGGDREAGGAQQQGLGVLTYNLRGFTPEEVSIVGTKGRLLLRGPAHICTRLLVTKPSGRDHGGDVEEAHELPLPAPLQGFDYQYPGSEGFAFEIAEVQRCLQQGLKECPGYGHEEMLHIARTMEEVRAQLGYSYSP